MNITNYLYMLRIQFQHPIDAMKNFKPIVLAASSLCLMAPLTASATLTVTFTNYLPSSVPMSSWMIGLTALVLAVLAYLAIRSQSVRNYAVFAVTVLVGVSGMLVKKNANASNTSYPYNLTSNPFVDSGFGVNMTDVLTNPGPNAIVITSITDSNGQGEIDASASTCKVGTVLQALQSCTVVAVNTSPPPPP